MAKVQQKMSAMKRLQNEELSSAVNELVRLFESTGGRGPEWGKVCVALGAEDGWPVRS